MSPPGSKKRSIVWNYFSKSGDNLALCKLCKKVLKHFGGTTNLKQHLLRIHPTERLNPETPVKQEHENQAERIYFENVPVLFPGPSSVTTRSSSSSVQSQRKGPAKQVALFGNKSANQLSESQISSIDSKLLKMIIQDYQPLSLVENQGFLDYSRELQPLYKPPSRKRLTYDILPKYYAEASSRLKLVLSNIKYCAVTTDIWTSDSNRAYLTVTSHYIYEDKIQAHVLSTQEILGSHTAQNITEHLKKILENYNIFNKTATVVSDNGANIKTAVNDGLQKHHHPCFVHMLVLTITDGLNSNEQLGKILRKCQALVGHFKHSVVASEKLKNVQQQMGFPILKVKQDVATRWNSCYTMIDRLLQIKDPLCVAVANLTKAPEFLDADEWKILGECITILKPANDLTTILSGEKYPTVSLVIPLIRGFQLTLKNVYTETDVGTNLKNNLIEIVGRRLGGFESSKIVAKACFLDPRFKKLGFGTEENADNAQKWVTEELAELISTKNITPITESIQQQECKSSNSNDIWSHFDKKLSNITFSTPSTMVVLTIRQYLEMAILERQKDPLEFWAQHKLLFPELHELAIKYLCVPATSVPSERVFSKTGQLKNSRRNILPPKHLDYIIFLNSTF